MRAAGEAEGSTEGFERAAKSIRAAAEGDQKLDMM